MSPEAASGSMTDEHMADVNSFELFWPLVAGRTRGDSLYFLKTLKENVRGMIIFGKPEKANYSLLLATKRTLEVEKLLAENKNDAAMATLDEAKMQLDNAEKAITDSNGDLSVTVDDMNNKLSNLEKFLPWLATKHSDVADKINGLLDKVTEVHKKI